MNLLLAHRKTRPTGRVLAEALGVSFGVQIRNDPETLIRWGNAAEWQYDRDRHVVNKASAINLAGDKLRTLERLTEEGITVPEFQTSLPATSDGLWFGRSRRGFGGRDIRFFESPSFAAGAEWFSRYIPNDREYRFHVVGSEVVRTQRKYLDRPELDRHGGKIKNHANGYVFKAPRSKLRPARFETAIAAVQALGLDFGAVDAIIDSREVMYVLEVNTAPACSPLTAQAYINALRQYLE
jgi:glutathione synthase/RimK-type ligase-like ATP-grasp enzyme